MMAVSKLILQGRGEVGWDESVSIASDWHSRVSIIRVSNFLSEGVKLD